MHFVGIKLPPRPLPSPLYLPPMYRCLHVYPSHSAVYLTPAAAS